MTTAAIENQYNFFNQSYGVHITPLVIYSLGGKNTHTHTHTHTQTHTHTHTQTQTHTHTHTHTHTYTCHGQNQFLETRQACTCLV